MFNLLLNAARLLFLSIVIPIRKRSVYAREDMGVVYSYSFKRGDITYRLEIEQTKFTIKYDWWFIPDLVECLYHVSLYEEGGGMSGFKRSYPLLSVNPFFEPSYQYNCLAQIHIEDYFNQRGDV